jgi:hypothetical protein
MRVLLIVSLCIASCPIQAHRLPLGDGKVSTSPQPGFVFSCPMPQGSPPGFGPPMGAHKAGSWISGSSWDPKQKPVVEGTVRWPNARISIGIEGQQRVVRANNLPSHETGEFPIRPGSAAFAYDRNPNRIAPQTILLRLPVAPMPKATPACVPMGMVGFALSGVAIFNALDLAHRDAPAHEIQDKCNGHPEERSSYHYHNWSPCLPDPDGKAGRHSSLAGWMLDGFPIFGPKGDGGKPVRNADLDACHGHTHAVMIDGKQVVTYHYHFTAAYPYTIGCFKGAVVRP